MPVCGTPANGSPSRWPHSGQQTALLLHASAVDGAGAGAGALEPPLAIPAWCSLLLLQCGPFCDHIGVLVALRGALYI